MGYKVNKIRVRPNGVEKQVYPAVWTPGSNTIAYFPFKDDTIDKTGNLTLNGSWTKDGYGYRPTSNTSVQYTGTIYFVNYWIKINSYPSSLPEVNIGFDNHHMCYSLYSNTANLRKKIFSFYNSSYSAYTKLFEPTVNTRHNISIGYNGSKTFCSIDGVVYDLGTSAGYNFGQTLFMDSGPYSLGDFIIESKARTSDEILNYYTQTKSNYGL